MPKQQQKSSRSREQESFPEDTELTAAQGGDSMVQRRHHNNNQEPNLVCHRHYNFAHSQEHETTDGVSNSVSH